MTDAVDMADRLAAAEADNARLCRLLDEAGMTDGQRHGLRDTIAMLRAIVRHSAETVEDEDGRLGNYVAHLEGRLDTIARVRARTDAFGEADLHTLVSDELLFHLVREGERATIEGPPVGLRPQAAQILALAVHELVSNAVEHGALGGAQGRVEVAWRVEPGEAAPRLTLVWKETGGTGVAEPTRQGFGTAVLRESLAHELHARTELVYEPDGLRCAVEIPLTARIGRPLAPGAGSDG